LEAGRSPGVATFRVFRTCNLPLDSDFGLGLIRQSEFRTVAGGSADYFNRPTRHFTLLAGLDYEREAPRRDVTLAPETGFRCGPVSCPLTLPSAAPGAVPVIKSKTAKARTEKGAVLRISIA
jgi:hypothetical protein